MRIDLVSSVRNCPSICVLLDEAIDGAGPVVGRVLLECIAIVSPTSLILERVEIKDRSSASCV